MTSTIAKPSGAVMSVPRTRPRWRWWSNNWWSGLAFGSAAGVLLAVWGLAVWDQTTGWPLADLLLWTVAGLLFLALFDGILSLALLLLRGLTRVLRNRSLSMALRGWGTWPVSMPLAALWLSLGWVLFPDHQFAAVTSTTAGGLVIVACMLGGAAFGALRGKRSCPTWTQVAAGLLPILIVAAWFVWPGPGRVVSLPPEPASAAGLDPGAPGDYAVFDLTYGSGNDARRVEYGTDADFITQPVDGTALWGGFGGIVGWRWEKYWGFGRNALPLNGLAWYPGGSGPFPLVLMVHGNHAANRFSDAGYEYLGRHLASRGFIAVSIDENFLNGTLVGDPAGAEMDLRGWLLLQHLAQWQRWNSDPGFPLYGQVATQNVGLVGHSRGGEAAAAATAMLDGACVERSGTPDRALAEVDIEAVVAIAPSDGLYNACGSIRLSGTSYLTINGGMDADVGTFYGLAQYGRTEVRDDHFKAYAYLHRANHGQFNQDWGYGDLGVYDWVVLDRASLLTPDEQQRSANVIIGAFLEAALHGKNEYRGVFRSPDSFSSTLPDDVLVTGYQDAFLQTIEGQGQKLASEMYLEEATSGQSLVGLRVGDRNQENFARSISWQVGSDPAITYRLETPSILTPGGNVSLDLASATDAYLPEGISVTLYSGPRTAAAIPLDLMTAFRPPLATPLLKWPGMAQMIGRYQWKFETERVLQTYEVPAAAFLAVNPQLDLANITALQITIGGEEAGSILIDQVGFRSR